MKLKEGRLVQWQDSNGAWHRGRYQVYSDARLKPLPVTEIIHDKLLTLVKHSYTQELEFVDRRILVEQPEEHPE